MTTTDLDKFYWVGSIETVSGVAFNVLDPTPEMFDIDDIARSLSHICRYNGHLPHFYSVAEHSVRVSWWIRSLGYSPSVQLTGLLHDAAEAYVGDMVRPLKRTTQVGDAHRRLEDRVSEVLHTVFGGIFPHPEIVHDADRAIYDWEVAHIRTGTQRGMHPDEAMDAFLARYHFILSDINQHE